MRKRGTMGHSHSSNFQHFTGKKKKIKKHKKDKSRKKRIHVNKYGREVEHDRGTKEIRSITAGIY